MRSAEFTLSAALRDTLRLLPGISLTAVFFQDNCETRPEEQAAVQCEAARNGDMTVRSEDITVRCEGAADTQITLFERGFETSDLEGKDVVIAASDDAELNRRISELCRARGILVNVCTGAEYCDFQFPSVVEIGPTVIGINASGKDHTLVKETRRRVEKLFENANFKSKYEFR